MGLGLNPDRVAKTPVRRLPPSRGWPDRGPPASFRDAVEYEHEPEVGERVEAAEGFILIIRRQNFHCGTGGRCQARLPGDAEFFRKA
jgi:hypothetical protein